MKDSEKYRRDFLKLSVLSALALVFKLPNLSNPGEEGLEVKRLSSDVLSLQTQKAISIKAQSLVRLNPKEADALAGELRGSKYSSANNICGPLAAVPLLGTVITGYKPADFWEQNAPFMDSVFPESNFDRVVMRQSIADFDFGEVNLQPGDFLYLFKHGGKDRRNEHMLTISRRDESGILWSVTNYPGTYERFVIKEVPFWNPGNPDASFVKELAAGKNPALFSTGQRGFNLWRLREGQPSLYDLIRRFDWRRLARPV